jgi:hypothetical protein
MVARSRTRSLGSWREKRIKRREKTGDEQEEQEIQKGWWK